MPYAHSITAALPMTREWLHFLILERRGWQKDNFPICEMAHTIWASLTLSDIP